MPIQRGKIRLSAREIKFGLLYFLFGGIIIWTLEVNMHLFSRENILLSKLARVRYRSTFTLRNGQMAMGHCQWFAVISETIRTCKFSVAQNSPAQMSTSSFFKEQRWLCWLH